MAYNYPYTYMQKTLIIGCLVLTASVLGVLVFRPTRTTMVFSHEPVWNATTLATQAQLIVVGQIKPAGSWTDMSTGSPIVLSDWRVTPTETLKGKPVTSLTMTTIGGSDRGEKFVRDGSFDLRGTAGKKFLLYLTYEPSKDRWIPLSATQGIYDVNGHYITDAAGRVKKDTEYRQAIISQ